MFYLKFLIVFSFLLFSYSQAQELPSGNVFSNSGSYSIDEIDIKLRVVVIKTDEANLKSVQQRVFYSVNDFEKNCPLLERNIGGSYIYAQMVNCRGKEDLLVKGNSLIPDDNSSIFKSVAEASVQEMQDEKEKKQTGELGGDNVIYTFSAGLGYAKYSSAPVICKTSVCYDEGSSAIALDAGVYFRLKQSPFYLGAALNLFVERRRYRSSEKVLSDTFIIYHDLIGPSILYFSSNNSLGFFARGQLGWTTTSYESKGFRESATPPAWSEAQTVGALFGIGYIARNGFLVEYNLEAKRVEQTSIFISEFMIGIRL